MAPKGGGRGFSSGSTCEDPSELHLVDHYDKVQRDGKVRNSLQWLLEFGKAIRVDHGDRGLVRGWMHIVDAVCQDLGAELDPALRKELVKACAAKETERIHGMGMHFCEVYNQAVRKIYALGPAVVSALGLPPRPPAFDAEKQTVWARRKPRDEADFDADFEKRWAKAEQGELEAVETEGEDVEEPAPDSEPAQATEPEEERAVAEPTPETEPEPADTGEPGDDTGEPEPVAMPAKHTAMFAMSALLEDV